MYIYVYIYTCVHVSIYMQLYMHIYICKDDTISMASHIMLFILSYLSTLIQQDN